MRAASLLGSCLLLGWLAAARASAPTIDEITALSVRQREMALAAIRDSTEGDATLLSLATQVATKAESRRDSGLPPQFPGCLRADEFEWSAQIALARAAVDARTYRVLAAEYRRVTTALQTALSDAQSTGNWGRRFGHLGHWITDWRHAAEPRTRELLRRTLSDQAIRESLSAFHGAKIYGKTRSVAVLHGYDEFVFNLMCASDEDNLNWLKEEVARDGWFDIRKFGVAADHAAWLLVQHADGAPDYQAYVAQLIEPKIGNGDTNPDNFAQLTDRVAVRAGRAQTFGTQMECVNGQWLPPRIADPEELDARRAKLGLAPYAAQLATGTALCAGRPARSQ